MRSRLLREFYKWHTDVYIASSCTKVGPLNIGFPTSANRKPSRDLPLPSTCLTVHATGHQSIEKLVVGRQQCE
jgi:hypothetical protein